MLALALDTTTRAGSVALIGRAREVEVPLDAAVPVAMQLPSALMDLLARNATRLDEIDFFAVSVGPGSFTGIRIGIATMQGLALAQRKPLLGVSAFDALAACAPDAQTIATWIDAWRGEVYGATRESEALVAPPQRLLQDVRGAITFIGDGAVRYRDLITATLGDRARVIEPTPLLAAHIGRLALARAERGDAPPPHAIRPLYVRRPDAELARERAHTK
jgi:tRNA threonylcarbamoyladenosine biosynthesis protein TsaB